MVSACTIAAKIGGSTGLCTHGGGAASPKATKCVDAAGPKGRRHRRRRRSGDATPTNRSRCRSGCRCHERSPIAQTRTTRLRWKRSRRDPGQGILASINRKCEGEAALRLGCLARGRATTCVAASYNVDNGSKTRRHESPHPPKPAHPCPSKNHLVQPNPPTPRAGARVSRSSAARQRV